MTNACDAPYTLVLLRHGESSGTPRTCSPAGSTSTSSEKGRGRGRARRRAARDGGPAARRRAHLAAASAPSDRADRARGVRPALDPGGAQLAPQRAALRRPAGQEQEADPRGVRRGAVHALAPVVRHPAAAHRPRRRVRPDHDPRYAGLPPEADPLTECLKDVVDRLHAVLGGRHRRRDLRAGKTVLVAAHGNSLRALVKHLDGISDDDIAALNIPTGIPLVYRLDDDLHAARARRRVPRPGAPPPTRSRRRREPRARRVGQQPHR